jgi:class 3 adenylate cyclase/tetratricopeptide (TPR) repeat protein
VSETPSLPAQTDRTAPPLPPATLPPNLERYLPPHLWRQLTEESPRRKLLLNALDRLRSLHYLLCTYLPAPLVQEVARQPQPGRVQGELLDGTLLFADVSGFTALSERLADLSPEEGAEKLTLAINRYFERTLKILAWSGGTLLKFAGDALLAHFPAQADAEQARWAVRAGQRMLQATAGSSAAAVPAGEMVLQVKIGLSSGPFLAARVGSVQRMEYVLLGQTVARTMAAEGAARAGQLIVDRATAAALEPSRCAEQAPGFHAVQLLPDQELGDFEIKTESRRARRTAAWIADTAEVRSDIASTLQQIEALSPYLPRELVDRIIANVEQRQVDSEFRWTTVLFANFSGPEALLSATPDPAQAERATRLLNDYFNAVHRTVARYGGVLTRIDPFQQGSKVLVLFGAPVAHEDDPQRAVHTALAMNQEVAALNERWRRSLTGPGDLPTAGQAGPLLQQRIGIAQGRTFAGQAGTPVRREYTVMGDDVNLAARLMAAAQPGQVLLSQPVHEAAAGHFQITALPPIPVKGKSKPVPIFQVDGLRDDRLAHRLRGQGPLLGREAEMKRARRVLRRALAGQGVILSIRGPAGVGKSRLADALAAVALAQGAQVYYSECSSYTATAPYAPWIALLHTIAGIVGDDPPNVRGEKITRLLADLDLARDQGPLFDLLGLPSPALPEQLQQSIARHATPAGPRPAQKARPTLFDRLDQQVTAQPEREMNLWNLTRERSPGEARPLWQRLEARVTAREQARLFAAIGGLLEALVARAPLVLLLENAQWMDTSSRELLRSLDQRLGTKPILVLLVQREESGQEPGAGPGIALEPLSLEGTAALVDCLLGPRLAPAERSTLVQAIHERSGGNPLYVEEIVRLWLQRGATTEPADLQAVLRYSGTLQELVLSRLDNLPHGQRSVVRAASVVGDEFVRRDIGPLLEESLEEGTLDGYLAQAAEARLIFPLGMRVEARYAFRQTSVRELIYDSLPFARRRGLHARLAGVIEARYPGDLAQQAELLAHHYELAGDDLLAACYLLLSGHNAQQRYAYPRATACYSRALAILEKLPAEAGPDLAALRAQAHEGQGDVALLSGNYAAAAAAYRTAQALLSETAPTVVEGGPAPGAASPGAETIGEAEARLLVKQALVLPTQGQAGAAEDCTRRAWASPPLTGDLAPAATLAWLLWRRGAPEAGEWIEAAAMLVAAGANRWMAGVATLLRDLAGEWSTVLAAYQALDRPAGTVLAACRLGDQHLAQGDPTAARTLYDQAAAVAAAESDAAGLGLAHYRQAEATAREGNLAAAGAMLREALALLETAGTTAEDDRQVLRRVLAAVGARKVGRWPAWRWQHYDDALRIAVLFRP